MASKDRQRLPDINNHNRIKSIYGQSSIFAKKKQKTQAKSPSRINIIKISPSKNLVKCFTCLKLFNRTAGSSCKHLQCANCLRKYLISLKLTILDENIPCFSCKKKLSMQYIYNILGNRESFEKIKSELLNQEYAQYDALRKIPKFKCLICLEFLKVDEGITLSCDHRYCANCIKGHIENLINEGKVTEDEMKCPQCPTPITLQEIEGNTTKNNFNRYSEFSLRNFKPKSRIYLFKQCFNCDAPMEIYWNTKEITCPGCQWVYCPRCNNKHTGFTCQEFEFLQDGNKNQEDIPYVEGMVRCPKCRSGIVRISGCNFMTCRYPACGETNFCFLCEKQLRKDQAFSHFKTKGPFGKQCNTNDGIEDD